MSSRSIVILAAVTGFTLLGQAITELRRKHAAPRALAEAWTIGPEARWVCPPGGAPLDLNRRGALRRVLDALVTRRLETPGLAWSATALLEAGWPGDRVNHEPGMMRVYSAIRRLRALGLGEALLTRDDGYLIDPEVAVVREVDGCSEGAHRTRVRILSGA